MVDKMTVNSINMKLRERYLEALLRHPGHQSFLKCHERTNLEAKFQTISPSSDYVIISQTQTPSGYIDQCAVRLSDIIQLNIQNSVEERL